jgi:hypothetical protein
MVRWTLKLAFASKKRMPLLKRHVMCVEGGQGCVTAHQAALKTRQIRRLYWRQINWPIDTQLKQWIARNTPTPLHKFSCPFWTVLAVNVSGTPLEI